MQFKRVVHSLKRVGTQQGVPLGVIFQKPDSIRESLLSLESIMSFLRTSKDGFEIQVLLFFTS